MRIVVLSYYNPWICGGEHRPICFLEQDLEKGNEVVFVFESPAETEIMSDFNLFNHHNLKLVRRDKDTGVFEAMNPQADDIVSEDYLLTQTSHIKKWVRTLKNQYFSAQISFPTNIYAQHNACCMYFGSR